MQSDPGIYMLCTMEFKSLYIRENLWLRNDWHCAVHYPTLKALNNNQWMNEYIFLKLLTLLPLNNPLILECCLFSILNHMHLTAERTNVWYVVASSTKQCQTCAIRVLCIMEIGQPLKIIFNAVILFICMIYRK